MSLKLTLSSSAASGINTQALPALLSPFLCSPPPLPCSIHIASETPTHPAPHPQSAWLPSKSPSTSQGGREPGSGTVTWTLLLVLGLCARALVSAHHLPFYKEGFIPRRETFQMNHCQLAFSASHRLGWQFILRLSSFLLSGTKPSSVSPVRLLHGALDNPTG